LKNYYKKLKIKKLSLWTVFLTFFFFCGYIPIVFLEVPMSKYSHKDKLLVGAAIVLGSGMASLLFSAGYHFDVNETWWFGYLVAAGFELLIILAVVKIERWWEE